MVKAVDRAHAIGASALQVFIDNPTAWRRRPEPPAELPAFRERLVTHDIGPLAVHASYLINLAGPEPDFHARSVTLLTSELRVAPSFGARFVNMHIGSHRGTSVAEGTVRLADAIAAVLAEVDDGPDAAMLVLENSAGAGFGLGMDVDELVGIAEAVAAVGVPDRRVAFCLDTAHAWGGGVDLGTAEGVDAFLADFDARIGLGRLPMIHLNDSKVERGSRNDRHEHLGAGRIGHEGLARILTHPGLIATTYYLETPGMDDGYDAINVARAADLVAGRPLADLPTEALTIGGSRARTGPAAEARAKARAAAAKERERTKAKAKTAVARERERARVKAKGAATKERERARAKAKAAAARERERTKAKAAAATTRERQRARAKAAAKSGTGPANPTPTPTPNSKPGPTS
jgi:deoxyribonuclease IV